MQSTLEALEAQVLTITPEMLERIPALKESAPALAAAMAEERRAQEDLAQADAKLRATHERLNAINAMALELTQERTEAREAALEALVAGHEDPKAAARLAALEDRCKLILGAVDLLASRRIPEAQRRVRAAQADVLEAEARVLGAEVAIRKDIMAYHLAPVAVMEGGQTSFESPALQRLHGRIVGLKERARNIRAGL